MENDSERLSVDEFTRFQSDMAAKQPIPKCKFANHTAQICWPQRSDEACHKCGIERKENSEE